MKKTILAVVVIMSISTSVFANRWPDLNGLWLLPGLTVSTASGTTFLGGEVSLSNLSKSLYWGGIYLDIDRSAEKDTRYIVGPEFGYFLLGADLGYIYQNSDGRISQGFAFRPFVTFPFFVSPCLYYRHIELYDSGWKGVNEFGLQLKIPLPVGGQH